MIYKDYNFYERFPKFSQSYISLFETLSIISKTAFHRSVYENRYFLCYLCTSYHLLLNSPNCAFHNGNHREGIPIPSHKASFWLLPFHPRLDDTLMHLLYPAEVRCNHTLRDTLAAASDLTMGMNTLIKLHPHIDGCRTCRQSDCRRHRRCVVVAA